MRHIRLIGLISGFTLIELMVTITIMALLTVVAVPSFAKIAAKTELNNAADDVKQMILEAQSLAKNPSSKYEGSDKIIVTVENNTANLYYHPQNAATNILIKSVVIPKGVTVTTTTRTSSSSSSINFEIPGGKVDSVLMVTVASDKLTTNNAKSVTVNNQTGAVSSGQDQNLLDLTATGLQKFFSDALAAAATQNITVKRVPSTNSVSRSDNSASFFLPPGISFDPDSDFSIAWSKGPKISSTSGFPYGTSFACPTLGNCVIGFRIADSNNNYQYLKLTFDNFGEVSGVGVSPTW